MVLIVLLVMMTVGLLFVSGCGRASDYIGQVHIYCFGDYFDPDLIYSFEDETRIQVVLDTFDTNEELYPVVKNRTVDYDLICCSDYMVCKLMKEGLLDKVDKEKLSNYKYMDEKALKMLQNIDKNNDYEVPHTWGTYGIIYNPTMIDGPMPKSWDDLWDARFKNQIIMTDSLRESFMVALMRGGYSLNSKDLDELSYARDELLKQKELVYKYSNDSTRDLMIGGAAALGVITSGEVLYAQECNEDLEYVIPEEGSELWTDCWAITSYAKEKDYAYKFLDYMLRPENAYKNFEYLTYAIPNTGMYELMDEEERNSDIVFPSDKQLKKCQVLENLDNKTNKIYSQFWKEVKGK
ncbi:MAG: ABC transporter substrate-binding protein [Clostridia bacterium]|nr:ABC transporter substrate-binding protein [Clostridia bacterium]